MSPISRLRKAAPLLLRAAIVCTIALGIMLRLVLYFQNRNLIIDEANIVRNLAERGFQALAQPLSYEQYAPPVFLWIEKFISILFGYGERSMRAFPLCCGIAALFVFYKIGVKLISKTALLVPLALFSFGPIYVRYSSELKQYMPDTLIALLLIWAALCLNTDRSSKSKFLLFWAVAGTFAIWSSMPSVFVLSGVGAYYALPLLRTKRHRELMGIACLGIFWLLQFLLYYLLILRQQIGSEYLQNYHRPYFLYLIPAGAAEWKHNGGLLLDVLGNAGGSGIPSLCINSLLFLTGMVVLFLRFRKEFLLIALPVLLVLFAAALKQFSLIERVVLFMMPMILLVIGFAIDEAVRRKLSIPILLIGSYLIWTHKSIWIIKKPWKFFEITEGLQWVESRGGSGARLFIHDSSVPTYVYYTTLHPGHRKFESLVGARRMEWKDDYRIVGSSISDTAYFLYTGGLGTGELQRRKAELETNLQQVDSFSKEQCLVFVYTPKAVRGISAGTNPN